MTDIREKIKVRMVADRRQRGYAFFDMWAERVVFSLLPMGEKK